MKACDIFCFVFFVSLAFHIAPIYSFAQQMAFGSENRVVWCFCSLLMTEVEKDGCVTLERTDGGHEVSCPV